MTQLNPYLEKILSKKREEIARLKVQYDFDTLLEEARALPKVCSFIETLRSTSSLSLISEVKKASPSKGIIRESFDPIAIAQEFESCGASCLSVLTEEHYFLGKPDYIAKIKEHVALPVLRKDFIFDPIQVVRSKLLGADALLLIKAILDTDTLRLLFDLATSLGLECLVEVHNEEEILALRDVEGIQLVGINNRNLHTFHTDIQLCYQLKPVIHDALGPDVGVVAESGFSNAAQMKDLNDAGFDAVLIGEGLAKNPDLIYYFSS